LNFATAFLFVGFSQKK